MAEVKRYKTPPFRASFPSVFEPSSMDGGPLKYGLSAVWTPAKFTEGDKKLWAEILKAVDEATLAKFKKKAKDLPDNYKKGIRKGEEKGDMEGYGAGTLFANLTTKIQPGVVDAGKNPIGKEHGNTDEIYPGVWCRATITVYTYDNKGKGYALGLMNVQKIGDGPRLDSRTNAADDFDDEVDSSWLEQDEGGAGEDEEMPF